MLFAVLMGPLAGRWLQSITQSEQVARGPAYEAVQMEMTGRGYVEGERVTHRAPYSGFEGCGHSAAQKLKDAVLSLPCAF